MKLEELARQSSAAARTSVSTLEPPPIGEPGRPRWLVPALAGTAVAALVVGGLAVINRNGDAETPAPAATVPEVADPPRLALRDGVDEWIPSGALAIGESLRGEGAAFPTFQYYGTVGSDDPFADDDLVIGFVLDNDDETQTDGDPIVIRGRDGIVTEGTDEFGFDTTLVTWREDTPTGSIDLIVVSRTLDRDPLVAVAESIVIGPDGTVTPADSAGLDLLATAQGLPAFGLGADDGWMSTYLGADSESFLSITSSSARLADQRVAIAWWSGEVETVTIGGADAYLASSASDDPAAGNRTLLWTPEPGVVASLQHYGDVDVDVIALLDDVVELTPAEWAELTALSDDSQDRFDDTPDPDWFEETIAEGGGEIDGSSYFWTLSATPAGVCFAVETASAGSESCGGSETDVAPGGSARVVFGDSGDEWVAVVAVADPAVDTLRPIDDRVSIERIEWNGASWFVAFGPSDTDDQFDVISAGEVVDRIVGQPRPAAPTPSSTPPTEEPADELLVEFPVLADAGHGDVVFVADGETKGLRWAIGEGIAGLCLYTAGATDSISCNDFGGIAVFPSIDVTGATWSFVYSTHRDRCPIVLSSGTSPIVDMVTDGVNSVWIVEGESDGWQFGVEDQMVDLPQRTGSIEWPEGTCLP